MAQSVSIDCDTCFAEDIPFGSVKYATARDISRAKVTLKSSGTEAESVDFPVVRTVCARDINADAPLDIIRSVRPREINAVSISNDSALHVSSGPKGLALPKWDEKTSEAAKKVLDQHGNAQQFEYGKGTQFWDQYYTGKETFSSEFTSDWYCTLDNITGADMICPTPSPTSSSALILGCGVSSCCTALQSLGYARVVSLDISPVAIAELRSRHAGVAGLEFAVGDCCCLPFPTETFDLVLDKATMDTLLCAVNGQTQCRRALRETYRVLKPNGRLVVASHTARGDLLRAAALPWTVQYAAVPLRISSSTDTASLPPAGSQTAPGPDGKPVGGGSGLGDGGGGEEVKVALARVLGAIHARLPPPAQAHLKARTRAALAGGVYSARAGATSAAARAPPAPAAMLDHSSEEDQDQDDAEGMVSLPPAEPEDCDSERFKFAEWVVSLCATYSPDAAAGFAAAFAPYLSPGAAAAATAAAEAAAAGRGPRVPGRGGGGGGGSGSALGKQPVTCPVDQPAATAPPPPPPEKMAGLVECATVHVHTCVKLPPPAEGAGPAGGVVSPPPGGGGDSDGGARRAMEAVLGMMEEMLTDTGAAGGGGGGLEPLGREGVCALLGPLIAAAGPAFPVRPE